MSRVGSSILSETTPAATEEKHIFFEYLATGSREDGSLQVPIPYHGVSSLSHVQERWEEI